MAYPSLKASNLIPWELPDGLYEKKTKKWYLLKINELLSSFSCHTPLLKGIMRCGHFKGISGVQVVLGSAFSFLLPTP